MCLSSRKLTIEEKFGFRTVYLKPDGWKPLFYPDVFDGKSLPFNRWIRSPLMNDRETEMGDYPRGFHLFATLKDAQKYCTGISESVVKVKYRGVLARGVENLGEGDLKAIVVTDIFVYPPDKKHRPKWQRVRGKA